MLAQNFKSAADLDISEEQLDALKKVLVLLETGKMVHRGDLDSRRLVDISSCRFDGGFNMKEWKSSYKECGTVACIGGTAELISGVSFNTESQNLPMEELFYARNAKLALRDITPAQAALALRSYLTTGDAHWELHT